MVEILFDLIKRYCDIYIEHNYDVCGRHLLHRGNCDHMDRQACSWLGKNMSVEEAEALALAIGYFGVELCPYCFGGADDMRAVA